MVGTGSGTRSRGRSGQASELVDVDGEQDDGSIRNELADNDCRSHEASSGDEVSVVLAVGIHGRELIEALGEGIGD